MARHEHLCSSMCIAFRLLKHGELIGRHGLILMNSGLDVPAGKVAPVSPREGACAETAYRIALPVAVVDVPGNPGNSWIIEREAERPSPCGLWDFIRENSDRGDDKTKQCNCCHLHSHSCLPPFLILGSAHWELPGQCFAPLPDFDSDGHSIDAGVRKITAAEETGCANHTSCALLV